MNIANDEVIFDSVNDKVSAGGYANIYKGRYLATEVAIKIPYSHKENISIINELAILTLLQESPYIVKLHGYFTSTNDVTSIVTTFYPLGSLYDVLLKTENQLSWDLKYNISIDIASGLAFMHERNIIHRDIKGQNILLDANHVAKICDFGLSEHLPTLCEDDFDIDDITEEPDNLTFLGSPFWQAPEIFIKNIKSKKSDIYSMAMTFYEILTGMIPFKDIIQYNVNNVFFQTLAALTVSGERPCLKVFRGGESYKALIVECWQTCMRLRPDAANVLLKLQLLKLNHATEEDIDINNTFNENDLADKDNSHKLTSYGINACAADSSDISCSMPLYFLSQDSCFSL